MDIFYKYYIPYKCYISYQFKICESTKHFI